MKTTYVMITLALGVLGTGCAHTSSQATPTANSSEEPRIVVTAPHGRSSDGPPRAKVSDDHSSAKQGLQGY